MNVRDSHDRCRLIGLDWRRCCRGVTRLQRKAQHAEWMAVLARCSQLPVKQLGRMRLLSMHAPHACCCTHLRDLHGKLYMCMRGVLPDALAHATMCMQGHPRRACTPPTHQPHAVRLDADAVMRLILPDLLLRLYDINVIAKFEYCVHMEWGWAYRVGARRRVAAGRGPRVNRRACAAASARMSLSPRHQAGRTQVLHLLQVVIKCLLAVEVVPLLDIAVWQARVRCT